MSPLGSALSAAVLLLALRSTWGWAERADAAARTGERLRADQPRSDGPPRWFADALLWLGVGTDPGRAWPLARFAGAGALCWLAWTRPALAVALVLAAGLGLLLGPLVLRRRRPGSADEGLPAVIEVVIGELGAGRSLLQGLERAAADTAGGLGTDLAHAVRRCRQGTLLQGALDAWTAEAPGSARSLFVDALALAGSSGGSQVQALRGVAASLRERDELQREVVALGSQAKASATVLVVTPVAFAVCVGAADPAVGTFLVGTPAGWACVGLGAVLDAIGAWWMHRLIRALR